MRVDYVTYSQGSYLLRWPGITDWIPTIINQIYDERGKIFQTGVYITAVYPYITELDNYPPNYDDANQINPNHVDDKNHNGKINSDNYNRGNPLLSDYYPIIEDVEEANKS